MKKVLCFLLLFVSVSAFSQTDNSTGGFDAEYAGFVETGFAFGMGNKLSDGYNHVKLRHISACQFNPYFLLGGGVGIEAYNKLSDYVEGVGGKKLYIPLFINMRVNFLDAKMTPYISADVGYSIGGNTCFSILAGAAYKITDKTALSISVSYDIQNDETEMTYIDSKGKTLPVVSMNALSLNLGVSF